MKRIGSLLLAVLLSVSLVGCGGNNNSADQSTNSDLSGKISLNGSTSMEKLVNALAEGFQEKNQGVTVDAQFTGSSAGIEALLAGSADIGDSSRELKDEEKSKGAVENVVAIDGIAVVVHTSNKVDNLTKDQLIKIYNGEITNWKDVGGDDEKIVVIGREAGSGTRGAFEELLDVADQCKYAQELDNTGAVIAKVAEISGGIGYVSLDAVEDNVKTLKLDGVEATEANIKADKYFLKRPFVMATKGELDKQSDLVKAFFDYINSDDGQAILKEVGLISAK